MIIQEHHLKKTLGLIIIKTNQHQSVIFQNYYCLKIVMYYLATCTFLNRLIYQKHLDLHDCIEKV